MNMPGFSSPCSFGTIARTITERVLGSTRESTLATLPVNVCPGYATLVASSLEPGLHGRDDALGHGEVELDRTACRRAW